MIVRNCAGGSVFRGDKVLLVCNDKQEWGFPKGVIRSSEKNKLSELVSKRIKEETGMTLIPESVKEFGEVLKIQNGDKSDKNTIHIQQNFYYTCKVEDGIGSQELDDGEKALDFVLKFVPIEQAIAANSAFESDDSFKKQMAEREKRVLEILKDAQL